MRFRCNTCRGEYSDAMPNGPRYFHACPPVRDPRLPPPASPDDEDTRPFIERPDKRDENIIVVEGPGFRKPRLEGLGRTRLPPVEIGPP